MKFLYTPELVDKALETFTSQAVEICYFSEVFPSSYLCLIQTVLHISQYH